MKSFHHLTSVVGIVGLLVSFTSPWWSAQLVQGSEIALNGAEAQPLAWSLSLAAAAAYGASLLLNRAARRVTLAVLALLAAGAFLLVLDLSQPPSDALARAVEAITGIAGTGALGEIQSLERGVGPVAAVASSLLVFVGAVAGQFGSRNAPKRDRYSSQPGSAVAGDSQGAWDSLSEGRDPTTSVE